MFVFDPMPSPSDMKIVWHDRSSRIGALVLELARGWGRHRALLAWNRDLLRPASCAHIPDRLWRRRSALLCLRGKSLRESVT